MITVIEHQCLRMQNFLEDSAACFCKSVHQFLALAFFCFSAKFSRDGSGKEYWRIMKGALGNCHLCLYGLFGKCRGPFLETYKAEKIGHMCKVETGGLKKTCLNLGSGNLDFWRVPIISRAGNEWFPVPGLCTNNGVYTEHLLCGSQDWVPAHQGVPMWPAPQGPPGH